MNKEPSKISCSIGWLGPVTMIFVVLKLTNVIGWSWWWVFSPIWIPALVLIAGLAIIFALITIKGYMK